MLIERIIEKMKNINQHLYDAARKKNQADRLLRKILCENLDPALIDQIDFFQVENEVLHISVKSAGWASRIRFFGDQILKILKNDRIPVNSVQIAVHSKPKAEELVREQPKNTKTVPNRSIETLRYMSESMDDDNCIKNALERLINTAKKKSQQS